MLVHTSRKTNVCFTAWFLPWQELHVFVCKQCYIYGYVGQCYTNRWNSAGHSDGKLRGSIFSHLLQHQDLLLPCDAGIANCPKLCEQRVSLKYVLDNIDLQGVHHSRYPHIMRCACSSKARVYTHSSHRHKPAALRSCRCRLALLHSSCHMSQRQL